MGGPCKSPLYIYFLSIFFQEEAIPATLAVASARYGLLVSQLHHLSHQPQILPLTDLLAAIFKQPTRWLPENVGSVLLLLGQAATKQFLLKAVITSAEEVAHAFTGLALMTARFRRPFTAVFQRLDDVVESVQEGEEKDAVLSAIWRSLTQVSLLRIIWCGFIMLCIAQICLCSNP